MFTIFIKFYWSVTHFFMSDFFDCHACCVITVSLVLLPSFLNSKWDNEFYYRVMAADWFYRRICDNVCTIHWYNILSFYFDAEEKYYYFAITYIATRYFLNSVSRLTSMFYPTRHCRFVCSITLLFSIFFFFLFFFFSSPLRRLYVPRCVGMLNTCAHTDSALK